LADFLREAIAGFKVSKWPVFIMSDRCLVLEDRMGAIELGGRLQLPSMQMEGIHCTVLPAADLSWMAYFPYWLLEFFHEIQF
jgi:hypothetical protein